MSCAANPPTRACTRAPVQHSTHILMVPAHLLRVAQAYGLAQVERMAKAGLL